MEEREGLIATIDTATMEGVLRDSQDNSERQFKNPAMVDVNIDERVIYISITTPKGTINIIKDRK